MSSLAPGIYPNTPYDEYAAWPAVRASTLKKCARSLAHAHEEEINPKESTDEMEFGTAFHTALLEPKRFKSEYNVVPKFDRRTSSGKRQWEEFQQKYGHLSAISEEDYKTAKAMIKGVYECIDAGLLLTNAIAREVSFIWRDQETDLLCKGRIDALTIFSGWTYIIDLKSAKDASKQAFQRQMMVLGYYNSLAWYQHGLNVLAPHERKCALLAVEKTPPYCAVPYELDEEALKIGFAEMKSFLRLFAYAREAGFWPGYSDNIVTLNLPRYKLNEHKFNPAE